MCSVYRNAEHAENEMEDSKISHTRLEQSITKQKRAYCYV
jgi:hypothetical protein